MQYALQVAVVILTIAAERYVTKSAKQKIADGVPYTSGVFVVRPLTGEKAIFMYKSSVILIRVLLVLLVVSIIIINTTP